MKHNGKPFTDVIGEVQNGQLLYELTDEIYAIIAAVMETRKAGKLKLTMSFSPTGKGTVEVHADFDSSRPEHDRPSTTFFVGRDNSLTRNDPNQPKLPLVEVVRPEDTGLRTVSE